MNAKKFYRDLSGAGIDRNAKPPVKSDMEAFWKNIWSSPANHRDEAYWISQEEERVSEIPDMEPIQVNQIDIRTAMTRQSNWKAAGVDGVQAYWWKQFHSAHEILSKKIEEIIKDPSKMPSFLTEGITYMLPKNKNTDNPKNFRPITCLPVIYKIITSIIEGKISEHVVNNSILASEQNGCKKGSKGSNECLIIDMILTKQATKNKRNISIAWVDYQKAFDSVPHTWIERILRLYKVDPTTINFITASMRSWRTSLNVCVNRECYVTDTIAITKGIFQGDSLSPLLFCLAVNPLSFMLKKENRGYVISRSTKMKLTHLFYMDDLKLYAANELELQNQLEIVKEFSKDIGMEFGLEKCAYIHARRGTVQETTNITLSDGSEFTCLQQGCTYKYLGLQQILTTDQKRTKTMVEENFIGRLKTTMKTKLYSKSLISAINAWVIPVISHTFGVIRWTQTDLERLDRTVRTIMTKYRNHHPISSSNRMYLPRDRGGRGLLNLEMLHTNQLKRLYTYFQASDDPLHRALSLADVNLSPLNLAGSILPEKQKSINSMEQEWKNRAIHGRYAAALHSQDVDWQLSTTYLRQGFLMPETEGFIHAIQDQVISTRSYRKHILKQEIGNDRCRLCNTTQETIQHLTSACTYLAPKDYLDRHNKVTGILHQEICRKEELLKETQPFYKYKAADFLENDRVKVYWDMGVITDKEIRHNKPDILIRNKKDNTAFIIDISIPLDENIRKARVEKISKYTDLANELKDIYQLKNVHIVPIIISANGLVDRELAGALKMLGIREHQKIISLMQKAVILSTCSTIRRILARD